jgi:hypothetical protein
MGVSLRAASRRPGPSKTTTTPASSSRTRTAYESQLHLYSGPFLSQPITRAHTAAVAQASRTWAPLHVPARAGTFCVGGLFVKIFLLSGECLTTLMQIRMPSGLGVLA